MNRSKCQEAAEATRTPVRRYQVKRKRILIVEDDRLCLILLRQLLTAQGYEILQSSEGWDGITRARNEQPDLIVMDIKLHVAGPPAASEAAAVVEEVCATFREKTIVRILAGAL